MGKRPFNHTQNNGGIPSRKKGVYTRRSTFQDGISNFLAIKSQLNQFSSDRVDKIPVSNPASNRSFDSMMSNPSTLDIETTSLSDTGPVAVDNDDHPDDGIVVVSDHEERNESCVVDESLTPPIFPVTNMPLCSETMRKPHMLMAIELHQLCTEGQLPLHYYDQFVQLFKKYNTLNVEVESIPPVVVYWKH